LPLELLDQLRLAAEEHGAARVVVTADDLIALEVLLAWADGVQEADPAYRAETAARVRTVPSPDGIPVAALADDPERGSPLRLRDIAFAATWAFSSAAPHDRCTRRPSESRTGRRRRHRCTGPGHRRPQ
jgi:hypothetical protein